MFLRVTHKLNLLCQISTRLCKLDRVNKALFMTKNTQNNRQKAFAAKNFIQINNVFTFGSKNVQFSCVRTRRHVIFGDASGLFNARGDRLIKSGAALQTKLQKLLKSGSNVQLNNF